MSSCNGNSNCAEKEIQSYKRTDYISWDEYLLAAAFLAAKRSKDHETQVGACLVDGKNRIVGVGYNGFPRGCGDDDFPWSKHDPEPINQKYMYVVHAEMNAILNKNVADVSGSRVYVTLFPCNEGAKVLIQSGIKEVIYCSDKHAHKSHTIASKRMFDTTGVKYTQLTPTRKRISIEFEGIDWVKQSQVQMTPKK